MYKVMIVDNQKAFVESLYFFLKQETNIEIVAQIHSVEKAIHFLKKQNGKIDLVLLSLQLNKGDLEGLRFAQEILQHFKSTKLLVYSIHSIGYYIKTLYDLGLHGYLFRDSGKEEYLRSIRQVLAGKKYYSPIISLIIKRYTDCFSRLKDESLSDKEMEILSYSAEGYTVEKIAATMTHTVNSVKASLNFLIMKFNADDIPSLIQIIKNKKLLN